MRTLTLQLVGTSPIILHHISRHQFREQLASTRGEISLEEEALEVMIKDDDGNPVVPVSWIWDSIQRGCLRITVVRRQLSFIKLQSSLHLPFGSIRLTDTDNHQPKWEVYTSIQHAAPGSRHSIAVVAPMFRDWMLTLKVEVGGEYFDDALLKRVFIEAGKAGIGLFHPPKKQYGQFAPTFC